MAIKPLPPLPDLPPEALEEEYNDAFVEKYAFDENGLDRGLIWENLQRSPDERLRHLEGYMNSVAEVREGSRSPGLVQFSEILRTLVRHEVEFVVVGATAANLRGVDISTSDLDIVFRQTAENRSRLTSALEELDASYFDPAGRTILPSPERLRDNRLNLLRTRLGRLDALSRISARLGLRRAVCPSQQRACVRRGDDSGAHARGAARGQEARGEAQGPPHSPDAERRHRSGEEARPQR